MDNRSEKAFHQGRNPHDQYILRGQHNSMGWGRAFQIEYAFEPPKALIKTQVLAWWAWMRFHLSQMMRSCWSEDHTFEK